jgi:aminomethyltransferase
MRDLLGDSILDLKYYWWRHAEIRGIPVVVTRTGWTSEVGYEIYLTDTSRGAELWETLMEVGAPHGVRPTGPSDIRRIEGGIFNWGADMTYEHNAFEMGLERLVDLGLADEACVSIAAYRRIKEAGISRRIVGVELDGAPFPELNNVKWPASAEGLASEGVTAGGSPAGLVTSAIYSPRLERNIGFCWLPTELAAEGTGLRVETEWGSRTATVVAMPFVDPEKRIPVG